MVIVRTKQGELRGKIGINIGGGKFYSFRGIPYARAPVGKLRFKAPEFPLPWNGIFNATNEGSPCVSKDMFTKHLVGTEDCLKLNVYTPKIDSKRNNDLLPVMFWIHGGGFTTGSGSSEYYGPDFLVTANVVLVTINYRLGILGFLSLEDTTLDVPGNAAFKDMVMALRWVQTNIKEFGGDPNNVTIFGESAGGVAAHLLMISPMSKGLFHKIIAQSGCALNPWARGRTFVEEIRCAFDFGNNCEADLLDFLQKLPVDELVKAQDRMPYFLDPNKIGPYGFVVEKETSDVSSFLSKEAIDIITSKEFTDVPFLLGFTKDEGTVVETYKPMRFRNMIDDFECNVPYLLGYRKGSTGSQLVAEKIRKFYFHDNETPYFDNRINFINKFQMVTDNLFLYGMFITAKKHSLSGTSPVYFYRMSIETSLKFLSLVVKDPIKGAAHGDDLAYLFKSCFTKEIKPGSLEYFSMQKFVRLWTNFAREGNPTPNSNESEIEVIWKPFEPDEMNFVDIGLGGLKLDCASSFNNMKFWSEIHSQSVEGSKYV